MSETLLASHFLFRFAVPCRRWSGQWGEGELDFDPSYRLPSFVGMLDGRPQFAELYLGWNEAGLYVRVEVRGKKQDPWCRPAQLEENDGLRLWIDTRDTHTVHRATRFCHQFVFCPLAGGTRQAQPLAAHVPIARATAQPRPVTASQLAVRHRLLQDGYDLQAWISAQALTGFDPVEQPRLGFQYAVLDRELGCQTFTVGQEFPLHDPSLWGTLELR